MLEWFRSLPFFGSTSALYRYLKFTAHLPRALPFICHIPRSTQYMTHTGHIPRYILVTPETTTQRSTAAWATRHLEVVVMDFAKAVRLYGWAVLSGAFEVRRRTDFLLRAYMSYQYKSHFTASRPRTATDKVTAGTKAAARVNPRRGSFECIDQVYKAKELSSKRRQTSTV